jgi:hypothetical protein
MLNGLDPIIIFSFSKRLAELVEIQLPIATQKVVKIPLAVIPVYLSEAITGVYIDTEAKNIDIETAMTGLISAESLVSQKPLASITTINLIASANSIGLTILLALSEQLIDLAVAGGCEVTYMHKAITVFGGLIHSFSIDQGSSDDLYKIKIEVSRGSTSKSLTVKDTSTTRLSSTGETPAAGASTSTPPSSQPSISPGGLR